MTPLLLVRHGESHWNAEHRYQGQQDSGLTARGRSQAEQVGRLLAEEAGAPGAIWSSDLPRAHDTAVPYAALTQRPIRTDPRLREVDVGVWSGQPITAVARAHPEEVARFAAGEDVRRGGGETFAEVRIRIAACLAEIVAEHPDETVVIFSHGGAIRVAAALAAGVPAPGHHGFAAPTNCSRTVLATRHQTLVLQAYNLPLPVPGAP